MPSDFARQLQAVFLQAFDCRELDGKQSPPLCPERRATGKDMAELEHALVEHALHDLNERRVADAGSVMELQ